MAFVFKSAKDLDKPIEKENVILSSKRIHKINKNVLKRSKTNKNQILENFLIKPPIQRKQSAFGSDQKRQFLYLNPNQCSPGPGNYDINTNFIKKSFNNIIASQDNNIKNNLNNIFDFEQKNLKLFISKEERFKKNNIINSPGPGQYEVMKIPNSKRNSSKKYEIKNCRSYFENSLNREISIPSKGNNYGYIIDENGNKILDENPLNGKNENNVGPGSYEIKMSNWNKNFIDWSKGSSKNNENKKNNRVKEDFINKMDILINEFNNMRIKDNLINNINTEPTISSNCISVRKYKDTIVNDSLKDEDENKNKNNNIKNNILKLNKDNNLKNDKKNETNIESPTYNNNSNIISKMKNNNNINIIYDDHHDKNILSEYLKNKSENPGPGKYNYLGKFEYLSNIHKNNNFGSSLSRGLLYPKERNKIKIGNPKVDKNLRIYSSFDENNLNNNILKNEFNNMSKKINKNKSNKNSFVLKLKKVNSEEKKDKIDNENDNINKTIDNLDENNNSIFKNNHSNIENFGSLEKRFYEIPTKETTPGVGSYSLVKTQENEGNKYRNNSPFNNIIIQNLKKSNYIPLILKNDIYHLNHKTPPVGLYSPEAKNSIEYDCKKKIRNNGQKIGFLNKEERFFQLNSNKNCSNDIGKYNIIKEDKHMEQQKSPFIFSEEKNKLMNILNLNNGNNNDNLGPGAYRYDSYFDWIKKSYNKDFT